MGWVVLAAVIAVPIAEFAVFAKAAQWIGTGPTILLTVAAAFAGIALMRLQGMRTMLMLRGMTQGGAPVGAEMFDGLCVGLAGLLLLLPGFLSDAAALILLIPAFRRALLGWAAGRIVAARPPGPDAVQPEPEDPFGPRRNPTQRSTTIIEGEYTVLDDDERR